MYQPSRDDPAQIPSNQNAKQIVIYFWPEKTTKKFRLMRLHFSDVECAPRAARERRNGHRPVL